ncbi:MAG: hypothetical protein ABW133_16890 [Polyangiaceae bacterium]
MTTRWPTFVSICLLSAGCSSSSEGVGAVDPGQDSGVKGHSLTLSANFVQQAGEYSFLTPTLAVVKVPAANIVGKPYLISSFPAGFSPGNDPPIHYTWGTVPADFKVGFTTPSTYANGPYDMVLAVYTNTPITDEIRKGPPSQAPATKGGDLATFTFDMGAIRPGDPAIPPGLIRFNVEGSDASVTVENKVTTDPSQIPAALTNTIMLLP